MVGTLGGFELDRLLAPAADSGVVRPSARSWSTSTSSAGLVDAALGATPAQSTAEG
jgi:hypothetical protein